MTWDLAARVAVALGLLTAARPAEVLRRYRMRRVSFRYQLDALGRACTPRGTK